MRERTLRRVPSFVALALLVGVSAADDAEGQARARTAPARQPAAATTPRAAAAAAATPAAAADEVSLSDVKMPVKRRGSVKALGTQETVVGSRRVKVAELAASVFKEQRALEASLRAHRGALFADPITTEELIETDVATILVSSTTVVVRDPRALPLGSAAPAKTAKTSALSSLDAAQLLELAALKKKLAGESATHPLRVAAEKGDQALLDAITEGKGELTVTDTVALARRAPGVSGGTRSVPALNGGFFDYGTRSEVPFKFALGSGAKTRSNFSPTPSETSTFLNGFSFGFELEREKKWEGTGWRVRVNGSASAGAGFRVPFRVKGSVSPKSFTSCGSADPVKAFTTTLSAETVNGSESLYTELGLPAYQAFDGKEVVLQAGASFRLRVRVLGKKIFDKSIGKEFDEGRHCKPALGGDGGCSFELWIPPETTGTKFSLVNGISAELLFGVSVSGGGELRPSVEASVGDGVEPSTLGSSSATKHQLSFTSSAQQQLRTELPPLTDSGQVAFGYRVSDTEYRWSPTIKPGVRGQVVVDVAGLGRTFVLGELWGPTLGLGTVTLKPHAGTESTAKFTPGVKKFTRGPNANGVCIAEKQPLPSR